MKKNLFLSAALIGALFTSCKKSDTTPATTTGGGTTTPTVTYLISKDSTTSTDTNQQTEVRRFTYNSSKKLIKIEHKYGSSTTYNSFDTLIYNGTGQLVSHTNYSIGGGTTANSGYVLSYNGSGQLTTVVETGTDNSASPAVPYVKNHTFTYTSGKITGMTSVYVSGANGNSNDTITNMVYTGDNITSVIYDNMAITATVSTTAVNPYYGLGVDPTDFINSVNKNNILKASLVSNPTIILQDNAYTYANGRVATIVSSNWDNSVTPNVISSTSTTVVTYKGL